MAKSSAMIGIEFRISESKFIIYAEFENQFELVYLTIDQKHDIKILANELDISKCKQIPTKVDVNHGLKTLNCNLQISDISLQLLTRYACMKDPISLKLRIKFIGNKFEINLRAPEHVCNALIPLTGSTSQIASKTATVDSLAQLINLRRTAITPSVGDETEEMFDDMSTLHLNYGS